MHAAAAAATPKWSTRLGSPEAEAVAEKMTRSTPAAAAARDAESVASARTARTRPGAPSAPPSAPPSACECVHRVQNPKNLKP
eukprot:333538-Prorocentrum_minimum.AAC.2